MTSDRIRRLMERLLDEAEVALAARDWRGVAELADHVLTIDPESAEALAFRAAAERGLAHTGPVVSSPLSPVQETHIAASSPTLPSSLPQGERGDLAPASFANGRYQVKRFLGEGGKKRVYLAHDTLLDRDVAFALIKTEGLDAAGRDRIRREAQAMGRLGSHPHIVSVFDLGEEAGGEPYIVTELMGGGDVEGLIDKAPEHRLELGRSLEIGIQVCRGLEFAHSHGIVHRDLKPGNVWLTADLTPGPFPSGEGETVVPSPRGGGLGRGRGAGGEGVAKLGDFGLAVALDRSRLTQAGMMVGTVSYMPPEQAMGGEVTPRSDLYSLGAMLYELVTGRPPFLGDDSIAIIGQHINTAPVAPSWHNPGCPRPLEALILRLLAKDPAERPATAADVRAALEAVDARPASTEGPTEEGKILDSLAGGVFVGRQREMGELKAALEDALSGHGRLVALVGEPGIGKTRTSLELATYAGLRQAQVLWGRCYEGTGAPPYWPWVQALRSYVQEREAARLQSEMGAGAADIAEVVSELRERLPELKAPPALEPEQARFRLFDSIATFLKNAGRRQPLVLILEDLHWADRPSLLLLEFVCRELSGSRLLVIGTYRDVEVARRHPLALTLAELTREQLFQRVLLRGLSQEDVGRFIELVAGVTPVAALVGAVYRQTEGNPLFVTEVVRLLAQEGHLSADSRQPSAVSSPPLAGGESAAWLGRIPEGIREVIGRRLDRLSERCNQVLTVASVIGREFTLAQVQPLVEDLPRLRLLEVLEEALAARVIEELPRAAGHYQFTHALIQETLVEELSTTRRVQMHAQIGEALEGLYGAEAEAHAAELAHHYGEAVTVSGPAKLVQYSLVAGERALGSHAFEEALGYFQGGLAAKEGGGAAGTGPAADAETAALLFGLGRAQIATFPLHQIPEAVATMRRAFDFYERAGEIERAVAVAEYPLPIMSGAESGGSQLTARALGLVPPDSLEAARLLALHGRLLALEGGAIADGIHALDGALEVAQRVGDRSLEMRIQSEAAEVLGYGADFRAALERASRALDLVGQSSDSQAELSAHLWVAFPRGLAGESDLAAHHALAMIAPAERLRYHFYLARALFANAWIAILHGHWEVARELTDRALLVSPREVRALFARALVEHEVGEFDQGEEYLERMLEATKLMPGGATIAHAFSVGTLGAVARITGKTDRYPLMGKMARAVLDFPAVVAIFPFYANLALALMAVERGDEDAARELYEFFDRSGEASAEVLFIPYIDHHHLLGLLALMSGGHDLAARHFEDSLAFCRKAGYRPALAWTCVDYGHMLLEQERSGGVAGDRAKATGLLDEGLQIARELGMKPLVERALRDKEFLSA